MSYAMVDRCFDIAADLKRLKYSGITYRYIVDTYKVHKRTAERDILFLTCKLPMIERIEDCYPYAKTFYLMEDK